jgi:two-component system sensor histidine kinase DegS
MKAFRKRTGIQVSLSAFAGVEQLNGNKRTVLYRVAQEALTNVGRHAEASVAKVSIKKLNGAVDMRIKDNGRGFRDASVRRAKNNHRLGLLGMRERLEMVGGKLTISSKPGRGSVIQAQIPFAGPRGGGGKSAEDNRNHQT